MLQFNVQKPKEIVLLTTFRCNAACVDCCFGCRPDRGRTMTLEQMKRYIDLSLEAYPDSLNTLSLTGGECFLLGDDLKAILRYGKERGLVGSIISNGYWGRNYREAVALLRELKECGLAFISFSMGNDHNHLIPMRNCRNAAVAAARLGMNPGLRVESRRYEKEIVKDPVFLKLINSGDIKLQWWGWQEYNNEINHGRSHPWRMRPHGDSKPCRLLFSNIILTPYGDMMACCGIGCMRNPYMRLGNIEKEPLKDVYERAFQDALKVWIYAKGAEDVIKYVYDNSKDIRFHRYWGACESCIEIFENPKILPLLRERYHDWASKIQYELL